LVVAIPITVNIVVFIRLSIAHKNVPRVHQAHIVMKERGIIVLQGPIVMEQVINYSQLHFFISF